MCVVVDANVMSSVFFAKAELHEKFFPLLEWIVQGKAKLSLGGKLLSYEIAKKQCKFMPFLLELKRLNKIHSIDENEVEEYTLKIKEKIKDPDFDDPHVIALLIVSKASIICSNDSRMFKYVRQVKQLSGGTVDNPRIFTTIGHEPQIDMLCDRNICPLGKHTPLPLDVSKKLLEKIEKM